jgi:hypothetical protein
MARRILCQSCAAADTRGVGVPMKPAPAVSLKRKASVAVADTAAAPEPAGAIDALLC